MKNILWNILWEAVLSIHEIFMYVKQTLKVVDISKWNERIYCGYTCM